MRLDGKTAIVTGGGSGFGAAMVELFAAEGAGCRGRHRRCRRRAGRRRRAGAPSPSRPTSPRDDDTGRMVAAATGAFGRLDILVNNAGVSHWNQKLTEVSEADFDRVYAVNVKALYWAARHAVPVMAARAAARSSTPPPPPASGRGRACAGTTAARGPAS